MKNLIKNIKTDYSYYAHGCKLSRERATWINFIFDRLSEKIAIYKCKKRGHNWEHSASIGPESGSESAVCKCCGESFSHTYY